MHELNDLPTIPVDLLREGDVEKLLKLFGDGKLRNKSTTSEHFRCFLKSASLDQLNKFTKSILEKSFPESGYVLQDLVNEVGCRLGFNVTNGLYQGVKNEAGHDGLWETENSILVIEVKTTDAYRINLTTIASYATKLKINGGKENRKFGMLLVVGRQDTGDLEAQIRGSKFAWDVRLISIDSLMQLARLVSTSADEGTVATLRRSLFPLDFTNINHLISLLSELAIDVERAKTIELNNLSDEPEANFRNVAKSDDPLAELKMRIVEKIQSLHSKKLSQITKSHYVANDGSSYFISTSKSYKNSEFNYWFSIQSKWITLLKSGGALCLGMLDRGSFLRLPGSLVTEFSGSLNRSTRHASEVWHVGIKADDEGIKLSLPRFGQILNLNRYEENL